MQEILTNFIERRLAKKGRISLSVPKVLEPFAAELRFPLSFLLPVSRKAGIRPATRYRYVPAVLLVAPSFFRIHRNTAHVVLGFLTAHHRSPRLHNCAFVGVFRLIWVRVTQPSDEAGTTPDNKGRRDEE